MSADFPLPRRQSPLADLPAQDDETFPGDSASPHSRPSNKAEFALHIIRRDGSVASFQYAHLDSFAEFHGGHCVLRFTGSKVWQVTLTGRNLWKLYNDIHRHKIGWIQVLPDLHADAAGNQPVVESVEIEEVGGED